MPVDLTLHDDDALVLFEWIATYAKDDEGAAERNVLNLLEGLLERQLAAPFAADYGRLLDAARASVIARHGDPDRV